MYYENKTDIEAFDTLEIDPTKFGTQILSLRPITSFHDYKTCVITSKDLLTLYKINNKLFSQYKFSNELLGVQLADTSPFKTCEPAILIHSVKLK